MKITQQQRFEPITIILETAEEADAIWTAVAAYNPNLNVTKEQQKIINEFSGIFANRMKL